VASAGAKKPMPATPPTATVQSGSNLVEKLEKASSKTDLSGKPAAVTEAMARKSEDSNSFKDRPINEEDNVKRQKSGKISQPMSLLAKKKNEEKTMIRGPPINNNSMYEPSIGSYPPPPHHHPGRSAFEYYDDSPPLGSRYRDSILIDSYHPAIVNPVRKVNKRFSHQRRGSDSSLYSNSNRFSRQGNEVRLQGPGFANFAARPGILVQQVLHEAAESRLSFDRCAKTADSSSLPSASPTMPEKHLLDTYDLRSDIGASSVAGSYHNRPNGGFMPRNDMFTGRDPPRNETFRNPVAAYNQPEELFGRSASVAPTQGDGMSDIASVVGTDVVSNVGIAGYGRGGMSDIGSALGSVVAHRPSPPPLQNVSGHGMNEQSPSLGLLVPRRTIAESVSGMTDDD